MDRQAATDCGGWLDEHNGGGARALQALGYLSVGLKGECHNLRIDP